MDAGKLGSPRCMRLMQVQLHLDPAATWHRTCLNCQPMLAASRHATVHTNCTTMVVDDCG
jgi:hypothetical protein